MFFMNTSKHIDALQQARIEANATLHDLHLADGAINELLLKALKKPYYTTSVFHAIDMQRAGHEVRRKWSWQEFRMVWWIYPKYKTPLI